MKKGYHYLRISLVVLFIFTIIAGCTSRSNHESSKHLVLACWVADAEIKRLVDQYNTQYPDLPIEITEYYNPNVDVDSALTQMNADLLSGKIVDLYCFDSLNLQGLINNGYVADLQPFIEKDGDFLAGKYYENILDQFQQDGSLYEMPSCFQLAGICIPSDLISNDISGWSVDGYIAFDNTLKSTQQTILSMDPQLLLEYMAQYSMDSFVDINQCQFECEEFYQLLEFIKEHARGNGGQSIGYGTWVFGVPSYVSDKNQLGTTPHYLGYPDTEKDGPCAMALISYGISSTTNNPNECWNFIKLTLDDDIYCSINSKTGFPLSRSALDKALELYSISTEDEQSPLYGLTDDSGAYYVPLDSDDIATIRSTIESVHHARFRYDGVFNIIREEGQAYLADDKPVEEVARLIQNRVSIFLAEQK